MGKVVALMIMLLLALASVVACFLLTGIINAGEEQMDDGQRRLAHGQDRIKESEVKLATGRRKLSEGKREYEQANENPLLIIVDNLLNRGRSFKDARQRIAKGNTLIAKGEEAVAAGEERLAAGELELCRGRERLLLARRLRAACAFGAACLVSLSIALGYRWRRSRASSAPAR